MPASTSEEEGQALLTTSSGPPPRNVGVYLVPMTEEETPENDESNVSAQLRSLGHRSLASPVV